MMASGHILAKRTGSEATITADDPKTPSDRATLGEGNQPDFSRREKKPENSWRDTRTGWL
jgi:hypothetical protein